MSLPMQHLPLEQLSYFAYAALLPESLYLLCVQMVESAVLTAGGLPGGHDQEADTSGSGTGMAGAVSASAFPSRQSSPPSTPSASARQPPASAWNSPLAAGPLGREGKYGSDEDLLHQPLPADQLQAHSSVTAAPPASTKLQQLLMVESSSAEPADTAARDAPRDAPEAGPSAPGLAGLLRLQRTASLVPLLPPAFGKSYALSTAGVQVLKITLQVSSG